MAELSMIQVQNCLDRLLAGDATSRAELLEHAAGRLERLTRKMLRDFPGVRRWEETADVYQNAAMRLHRALGDIVPPTAKDFFRLAAAQIRRELIDLSRHHFGPLGGGKHHASQGPDRSGDPGAPRHDVGGVSDDPARVALWTEFHRQVEQLPDDEREVFDLIWYQGLKNEEAAEVIGISLRTLQYRWRDARLRLAEALGGELPPT